MSCRILIALVAALGSPIAFAVVMAARDLVWEERARRRQRRAVDEQQRGYRMGRR